MSIRMKLADFISGGALTAQRNIAENRGELFSEYYRKFTIAMDIMESIAATPIHRNIGGKEARHVIRTAQAAVKDLEGEK